MIRRFFLAFLWTGLFLSLTACGGSGGGGSNDKGVGTTPLNVNIGDAPTDRIVAFDLTINSVVLTGTGISTSVFSTPTEVEFSHLSGTVSPLSLATVSNVAYNNVTITLSGPAHVTFIDDNGDPVTIPAPLTQSSVSVPISVTFNNTASTLNLELNLAQSVSLNPGVPPTATVTPVVSAAVVANAASNQTPLTGGFQEVTGAIIGIAGSSFTLSVEQAGQSLTFATDSNTSFSGVPGLAALAAGNVVQVDGATKSDGSLLATKVTLKVAGAAGMAVEGLVTGVTGTPVTGLDVVAGDVASSSAAQPSPGDVVTADVSAVPANRFLLNSTADLTDTTVVFDADHVALGQTLELDTATAAANNITATQVQLRDGTLSGTITGDPIIPLLHGGKQFTLALSSDSALVKLTALTLNPVTTITVVKQPSTTMLNGIGIAPSVPVRVRGSLFFNGGSSYTLVATVMTTP